MLDFRSLGLGAIALLSASAASAAPFTTGDVTTDQFLLGNFSAIVSGNLSQGSETEGRVVVGGNLAGGGNDKFCFNGCSGDVTSAGVSFGAATVYGNVTGGTIQVGAGDISIAGNLQASSSFSGAGGLNLVGTNSGQIDQASFVRTSQASLGGSQTNARGATTYNLAAATVFPYGSFASSFGSPLSDLAAKLPTIVAGLGNVQTIGDNTNNYSSTAVAATGGNFGGKSYGFYVTTGQNLADAQNFAGINGGGLSAVFVIVNGTGAVTLPTVQNGATTVIWDLPNATSVTLHGQFDGTVLAPNAVFSNSGGNQDALAFAASINQTNEFHRTAQFSGDISGLSGYADPAGSGTASASVPEPASLASLGFALAGLVALRRRYH